jgi:hypothetical protein
MEHLQKTAGRVRFMEGWIELDCFSQRVFSCLCLVREGIKVGDSKIWKRKIWVEFDGLPVKRQAIPFPVPSPPLFAPG